MSSPLLARQPFKALYTVSFLATLPIRLAAIFLYFIPRSLRPHPAWTYHQAIGNRLFALWFRFASTVEHRTAKSLKPGPEKERFVLLSPPSTGPSPYVGIANSVPAISPCTVGGVWYAAAPTPKTPPRRVVLYFHGGAYVLGGVRKYEGGWGPTVLSKAMDCPVLLPQYRLSVEDNASFPAALQDAITAYVHVISVLGVPAEEVVLAGESAGGHLALSLLRYLIEEGKAANLPLPRAALLWSPWLDLTVDAEAIERHPRRAQDFICGQLVAWGRRRFTPEGWATSHPYISHMGNEFHSEVPLLVHTGTAELLYEDHVKYAKNMKAKGTTVELVETPTAPHDIVGAGLIVGFVKEATEVAERAAKFVDEA